MFDIAWSELGLIAVVALLAIGPKDLPRVMRTLGQWTRRARLMAAEFQGHIDEMMREVERDEVSRKSPETPAPTAHPAPAKGPDEVKAPETPPAP